MGFNSAFKGLNWKLAAAVPFFKSSDLDDQFKSISSGTGRVFAVTLQIRFRLRVQIFWDMTLSQGEWLWCFGESWCHHLHGQEVQEDCFWTYWPWRWRHCVSLKHRQALTLYHSAILPKTPFVSRTAVRTSSHLAVCFSTCRAPKCKRLLWEQTQGCLHSEAQQDLWFTALLRKNHFSVAVWKPPKP